MTETGTVLKKGLLVIMMLAGIASHGLCFPLTAKDDRGKEIEFKERPMRIVSLVPTQTELLFSLGLEKEIVGVTHYCNYPEAARQKEKIAGFAEFDIEKIIALKPDLVLSFGTIQRPAIEKLEKKGLKVFWIYPHTVNDILDSFKRVGKITGATESARQLRDALAKELRSVRETLGDLPGEKRPTVFRVMGIDPPATIGSESFQNDVFYLAGGKNAFADVKQDYFEVDAPDLIKRNPDLIVMCGADAAGTRQKLKDSPVFAKLSAVQNDSVLIIPCDTVCRPGPRVTETIRSIARALYPEKFVADTKR